MSAEFAVGQRSRPGLHRGPFAERETAEEWIESAEADGIKKGAFYVITREVGDWTEATS